MRPRGKRGGFGAMVTLITTAGLLGVVVRTAMVISITADLKDLNKALEVYAKPQDDEGFVLNVADPNDPNAVMRLLQADANSGEFIYAPAATTQPAKLRKAMEEAKKELDKLECSVEKSTDSTEEELDTSGKDSGTDG